MTIVCTILTIAAYQSWPLYQFDVKNVFLHGDLKEEVCMRLPQGFFGANHGDVAHLWRSLYGLKQDPRAWFEKFREAIIQLNFHQSPHDPSLFLCNTLPG